jgi:hypothetical protein
LLINNSPSAFEALLIPVFLALKRTTSLFMELSRDICLVGLLPIADVNHSFARPILPPAVDGNFCSLAFKTNFVPEHSKVAETTFLVDINASVWM